jgi:hypothetical protein
MFRLKCDKHTRDTVALTVLPCCVRAPSAHEQQNDSFKGGWGTKTFSSKQLKPISADRSRVFTIVEYFKKGNFNLFLIIYMLKVQVFPVINYLSTKTWRCRCKHS